MRTGRESSDFICASWKLWRNQSTDVSLPNHPLHSIKVSGETGNEHHRTYSHSAGIKSSRNGDKSGLHGRILKEKSLGWGMQCFSFSGEDRGQECCPCAGQDEERKDRSLSGSKKSSSNRLPSTERHSQSVTHSSISPILDPVSDLA